jgi:hypothetical protein
LADTEKDATNTRNGNVHICAKTPGDEFTVRPKVDKARKEPSKIEWMSTSNV